MDAAPLFDFEREPIMEYCKKLTSTDEQIKYLKFVLKEYKTNPPDLDPNYGIRPGLVKVLTVEIEYRKEVLEEEKLKVGDSKIEGNGLKTFRRGELRKELKKYIKEFKLIEGVTVESKISNLITRKMIADGYNAQAVSVAVTLRKMGYGEELKKY